MRPEDLEWRMYGLVPYNISPIQQAIQYGHAIQEYNNRFFNKEISEDIPEDVHNAFYRWREQDKTFIILNGGTTNSHRAISTGIPEGTLNKHCDALQDANIEIAYFAEPDLGDQLTAVVFLVDERVFDKKKYPDFEYVDGMGLSDDDYDNQKYNWVQSIGGEKNVWLREFLSQFRLA